MSIAQFCSIVIGSPRRHGVRRSESPLSHALLQVVDAGLWSSIFVVPCFFGGRHDLGRFALVVIAAVTAVAWCARQAIRERAAWMGTHGFAVLLAACALLLLQVAPLPASVIQWLSPRTTTLLPLWTAASEGVGFGHWPTLSFEPAATRMALAVLVAYGLLFFTCVQRIRGAEEAQRLLQWVGLAGVAMALFALVQYFTANGRYFWFYELPFRTTADEIKGTFTTRSHFSHYLVLAAGPLAAWLITSQRQSESLAAQQRRPQPHSMDLRTLALVAALALVAFCSLLSRSRGGAVALVAAAAVLSLLYYRHRIATGKHLMTAAGVAAAVVALLSIHGYDKVSVRLDDFQEVLADGSLDALDETNGRRTIWGANVQAIRAGGLTGSGAGTHRDIYPVYLSQWWPKEFTHAESGYLQVATETGVAGALLLMCGIGLCGRWCWRAARQQGSPQTVIWSAAAAAGLAASIVQALVDFVWYIPGCMTVTVILAACALRYSQLAREPLTEAHAQSHDAPPAARTLSRRRWLELAVVAVLAGGWAVATMARPALASLHWDRFLTASVAKANLGESNSAATRTGETGPDGANRSAIESSAALLDRLMFEQLRHVVRLHPRSASAHLRLARSYRSQFEQIQRSSENPMSIAQVREAALASQFAAPQELHDWLNRAFGDSAVLLTRAQEHARLAVQLCPLQGEGYLYLADLCFLRGEGPAEVEAYVEQGLRVRPMDGDALFAAGIQRSAAGNLEEALQYWKQSFRVPGDHQFRIVDVLPASLPARALLDDFEPDWHSLRYVWNKYQALGTPQDLTDIAVYAAHAAARDAPLTSHRRAALNWVAVAEMQRLVGAPDQSLAALRSAYALAPHIYQVRLELGSALYAQGEFAEAEAHWRWCVARRPDNPQLRSLMLQAAQARLGRESDARAAGGPAAGVSRPF